MNKIIIFQEKYGDRYFDASTPEKLNAACFKILKERYEDDFWGYKDISPEPVGDDILTDEQIASLPTQSLKETESLKRAKFKHRLKNWQQEVKDLKQIEYCLQYKDHVAAKQILTARQDGEYESFEIEELESA